MANLRLKEIPTWEEVQELWNGVLDRFLPGARSLEEVANVRRSLKAQGVKVEGERFYLGLREVVFFGLLFSTGCRVSELLSIRKKDVNFTRKVITVRQLKKRGEKEVKREVLIPPQLEEQLREYVIKEVKGEETRLFEFSRQRAWQLVKRLTGEVIGRELHPHAFRHTFALQLLKTTKDLEKVRRILGHSNYDTLKVYLDYTIEDMKEELLSMFRGSSNSI